MLGLFLVACLATAAAAPVRWGNADTSALTELQHRVTQHTFNSTDLATAWNLLRTYAPVTATNAERTLANMTDEDRTAFRNNDKTRMTQIIISSYTACGDCLTETNKLSQQAQVNLGKVYTFVISFELLLNSTVDTAAFTDVDSADVDELVNKVKQGTFGESDLTKAWSILRNHTPVTAARAEATLRTMSAEDKEAFKHKDARRMMTILITSYNACGECVLESSKLNTMDQLRVGELFAFVINYVAASSTE